MTPFKKPIPGIPHFGWDGDSVRKYVESKPLVAGDKMFVYNGQGGMHEYIEATVENPSLGRQKRVVLSVSAAYGGSTFYRTGKNCYSPTGQSFMLPPTPQLECHLDEARRVIFSPH